MKQNTKYFLAVAFVWFTLLSSGQPNNSEKILSTTQLNFTPGLLWLDDSLTHINAHGGGILHFNGTYYWYGEYKISGSEGNKAKVGVSCYSSNDLYNWKNEGIVLKVATDSTSEITNGCIIERPKVIYNKKTRKFVMWFHLELKGQGYGAARTGVAISNSALGPYKYLKSFRPNAGQLPINSVDTNLINQPTNLKWWTPEWRGMVENGLFVMRDFYKGQMSRDMTVFVDSDGKAYHIHSAEENLTLHISELTDDYLNFTGKWTRVFPGGHNEAPAVFKRDGEYYMITSGCTGWNPNEARSAVSESIWGPWELLGNPCLGVDSAVTFNSQSTFVLSVENKEDSYIFMADRWTPKNPIDGRYIWLPIEFKGAKPIIKYHENWDLNTFKK